MKSSTVIGCVMGLVALAMTAAVVAWFVLVTVAAWRIVYP